MAKKFSELKTKPRKTKELDVAVAKSSVSMLVNFKSMRSSKGLTLRDCAECAGIDHATLYRIEIGAEPSLPNAIRFAKFLGIPVEKIWEIKDAA